MAALPRGSTCDLRALKRSTYVVHIHDVIDHLEGRPPTRTPRGRRASLFVPRVEAVRPYQWECLSQMQASGGGFVVAPCGSGKTLVGLLVAVLRGGRFLVLTTRYAEQWKATLDRRASTRPRWSSWGATG